MKLKRQSEAKDIWFNQGILYFQLALISITFILSSSHLLASDLISGTYYIHEWGQDDSNDNDYTGIAKAVFDGDGNFTIQSVEDSESDNRDVYSGSYTISNSLIACNINGQTIELRISPDGETLAGITAKTDAACTDEIIRAGVKASSLSTVAGTYYIHEWGQDDSNDNDYTGIAKAVFDGDGNFTIQSIEDSESDNRDVYSGSYTISNGLIACNINGQTIELRISPDGETLAGITAKTDAACTDEIIRVGVKASSLSTVAGTYYIHEWGQDDSNDNDYTGTAKAVFDGDGNFTIQSIEDSESNNRDIYSGSYTISNGLIACNLNGQTIELRVSPDGETIAGITAKTDTAFTDEIIRVGVKASESQCTTNVTGVTITGNQKANEEIAIAFSTEDSCFGENYYRFSMHPYYGTNDYDGTSWQSMTGTEWISRNSLDYTFTEAGKYIIVVWISDTNENVDPTGIPIIGWSVDATESEGKTNFTGVTITGEQKVNEEISFSVIAENDCCESLYYRFSMHPFYGTDDYNGTYWQSMTDTEWVSSNSLDYTFTEAGKYIIVVWVSDTNENVDPTGVPTIGWSVDIE